jgi:hypothetical protein
MVTTVADAVEVVDEETTADWLEPLEEEESSDDVVESTDESSAVLVFEVGDFDSTTGNEAIKDCKSVFATRAFWEDA